MATHSGTPTWKIPWTEKPDRLQSMGQRVAKGGWTRLSNLPFTLTCSNIYRSRREYNEVPRTLFQTHSCQHFASRCFISLPHPHFFFSSLRQTTFFPLTNTSVMYKYLILDHLRKFFVTQSLSVSLVFSKAVCLHLQSLNQDPNVNCWLDRDPELYSRQVILAERHHRQCWSFSLHLLRQHVTVSLPVCSQDWAEDLGTGRRVPLIQSFHHAVSSTF